MPKGKGTYGTKKGRPPKKKDYYRRKENWFMIHSGKVTELLTKLLRTLKVTYKN